MLPWRSAPKQSKACRFCNSVRMEKMRSNFSFPFQGTGLLFWLLWMTDSRKTSMHKTRWICKAATLPGWQTSPHWGNSVAPSHQVCASCLWIPATSIRSTRPSRWEKARITKSPRDSTPNPTLLFFFLKCFPSWDIASMRPSRLLRAVCAEDKRVCFNHCQNNMWLDTTTTIHSGMQWYPTTASLLQMLGMPPAQVDLTKPHLLHKTWESKTKTMHNKMCCTYTLLWINASNWNSPESLHAPLPTCDTP